MKKKNLNIGAVGCGYWGKNLLRNFAALPGVSYAEPNGIMRASGTPNDPQYSQQAPAYDQIRLPAA